MRTCGSLARVLLNFMRKRLPGMHYSFGDNDNAQLPHIVMPLWGTADQLIVTPPGATPPQLGLRLEDGPAAQKARLAKGSQHEWSLENTYSFSFCTAYLDLPHWKLVAVRHPRKLIAVRSRCRSEHRTHTADPHSPQHAS